jgi:uncharacterized membrane protein YqjE
VAKGRAPVSESVGELASGLAGDIQALIRGELTLARAELDQKIHRLILSLLFMLGGALVAFAGLVVLLEGLAAILAFRLPAWASLVIVGALIIVTGGMIALATLKKLSLASLTPDRSIANLGQDGRVIKEHIR